MAFHTKLPIVTDGLIFSVDPFNAKSYISGDTTTYDLTKNGNNGTLLNGVGFDTDSWTFDGVNERIAFNSFPLSSNTTDVTMNIWLKVSGPGGGGWNGLCDGITEKKRTRILLSNTYNTIQPSLANNGTAISIPTLSLDTWANITVTKDSVDGVRVYTESIYRGSHTSQTGPIIGNGVDSTQNGIVLGNGAIDVFTFYLNGVIGYFSIYNRALIQSEITQNFNSIKPRFI